MLGSVRRVPCALAAQRNRRRIGCDCVWLSAGRRGADGGRQRAGAAPVYPSVLDQEFGGFLIETLGPAGRHDPVPTRALLVEDAARRDDFVSLRAQIVAVKLGGVWRPWTAGSPSASTARLERRGRRVARRPDDRSARHVPPAGALSERRRSRLRARPGARRHDAVRLGQERPARRRRARAAARRRSGAAACARMSGARCERWVDAARRRLPAPSSPPC